jgi:hypothetical protein
MIICFLKRSIACIAMLTGISSCTKTEIIAPPAEAQNRILSYKITSVPTGEQPVVGSVNDTDSSITVYLPSYFLLEVMLPEITVSEGAAVTPSSGAVVENLLQYIQSGEIITYKVTGKDGSIRNYSLHIISQQPPTTVNELTADGAAPTEFKLESFLNIDFTGTNFVMENRSRLIKVVFTNESGVNLPALYAQNSSNAIRYPTRFQLEIGKDIHTDFVNALSADGVYSVTVYNYGHIVKLKNKIKIKKS